MPDPCGGRPLRAPTKRSATTILYEDMNDLDILCLDRIDRVAVPLNTHRMCNMPYSCWKLSSDFWQYSPLTRTVWLEITGDFFPFNCQDWQQDKIRRKPKTYSNSYLKKKPYIFNTNGNYLHEVMKSIVTRDTKTIYGTDVYLENFYID